MQVDSPTILEMFEVLRLKLAVTDDPPKIIRIKDGAGDTLCDVPFDDVEVDSAVPSDFYFVDAFKSKILRGKVEKEGTPDRFSIYDADDNEIISGTVGLNNSGEDIEFNTSDWALDQIVIISFLKIYFPS